MTLDAARTSADSVADHVADHNTLHADHNTRWNQVNDGLLLDDFSELVDYAGTLGLNSYVPSQVWARD